MTDLPLTCPSCSFTAPAVAFIPRRATGTIENVLLVLVTVLIMAGYWLRWR